MCDKTLTELLQITDKYKYGLETFCLSIYIVLHVIVNTVGKYCICIHVYHKPGYMYKDT
jgi:hypothetical protein